MFVPRYALHKKGLQRQMTVNTLVTGQQRRALAVLLTIRWSTGCFVPPPVYMGFSLFVIAKRRSEQLFMVPWRARGTVSFRAKLNVGSLFCSAWPRPAVRRAPRRTDPPVVRPGFGLDRFGALEGAGCKGLLFFGEKLYSNLSDPAWPVRRAPRTDLRV